MPLQLAINIMIANTVAITVANQMSTIITILTMSILFEVTIITSTATNTVGIVTIAIAVTIDI